MSFIEPDCEAFTFDPVVEIENENVEEPFRICFECTGTCRGDHPSTGTTYSRSRQATAK
jgi:hypothetical protein